jgi:hypothetical protein
MTKLTVAFLNFANSPKICPSITIKQAVCYVKNTTIVYNYWYLTMTTCFGLSLDHLQAKFRKYELVPTTPSHFLKMDLQEVGGSCGDWMQLAQNRDRWWALVGTVRNLRVPKMQGNFLTSCRTS